MQMLMHTLFKKPEEVGRAITVASIVWKNIINLDNVFLVVKLQLRISKIERQLVEADCLHLSLMITCNNIAHMLCDYGINILRCSIYCLFVRQDGIARQQTLVHHAAWDNHSLSLISENAMTFLFQVFT